MWLTLPLQETERTLKFGNVQLISMKQEEISVKLSCVHNKMHQKKGNHFPPPRIFLDNCC